MRRQAAIAASLALALSIGACGGGTSGDATTRRMTPWTRSTGPRLRQRIERRPTARSWRAVRGAHLER